MLIESKRNKVESTQDFKFLSGGGIDMRYNLVIIGDTEEAEYAIKKAKEQGIQRILKVPLTQILQVQQIKKSNEMQLLVYDMLCDIVKIKAKNIVLVDGVIKKNGRYLPDYEFLHANGFKVNPFVCGVAVNEWFETSIPHVFACGNMMYYHQSVHKIKKEINTIVNHLKHQLQLL